MTATATDASAAIGDTSSFVRLIVGGGGGGTQPGPTFTVNTNTDGTPADAGCTTTECTLREAITAANTQAGNNTIEFEIDGDTQVALQDALPNITSPVLIDGLSQSEGTIVINEDGAGAEVNGLQLATGSEDRRSAASRSATSPVPASASSRPTTRSRRTPSTR